MLCGCVQMYHSMLSRLFEQGAEDPDSPAHAELVELLALKVLPLSLFAALYLRESCSNMPDTLPCVLLF